MRKIDDDQPLSRKWMINWLYSSMRGQLDIADVMSLHGQIEAELRRHPDDSDFRDDLLLVVLWEGAQVTRYQDWLREKDKATIADLTARIERLEAERG